jgi:hypothetical protein
LHSMQLRDHPLMISSGIANWPPLWRAIDPNRNENPLGEIGVLDDVATSEFFDNQIFVFMIYRGWRYTGMMAFDSPEFCRQIYSLLKSNIGRPIKDIGDLVAGY